MRGDGQSENFEQYSDADAKSRSVSDISDPGWETIDANLDTKYSYTDAMSTCSACSILSPHSQLFVCTKSKCGYALKQTVPILSPSLFYRREKVFCGSCAFRGIHSAHKKYMKPAEPIAFKTSSGEVGTKLELKLEKFAELSDDTPVDYFVTVINQNEKLPKVPVVEYLRASQNIIEWHSRLALICDSVRTLKECCMQGHAFVKEQAEKLLTAYSHTSKLLEMDTSTKHQELAEMNNNRRSEHHIRMGIIPDKTEDDQLSFSSVSSSSRKSSICSTSSTNTVRQMTLPSGRTVSEQSEYRLIDGGLDSDGIFKERAEHSKFIDEPVRQTNIVLSRRFDVLRRNAAVDEAVNQIADMLDSRIKSVVHKKEVVKYMEETYSIIWPRKLQ